MFFDTTIRPTDEYCVIFAWHFTVQGGWFALLKYSTKVSSGVEAIAVAMK